ncbi:MAG: sodium:solute symporter family protein [Acidobacteriota bacterium]|nr:sodium:solute symporter family protein [Acidobacteriota bacterium]
MNLHLPILLVYASGLVIAGLWYSRRVKSTRDFFVAGRKLGAGLLFSTMLAANIGAGSTVGATSLGYTSGLSAWWWVGSAGFGSIVLALWIGPRIRAVAARHDLRTVGDFLEYRYGHSVRALITILLWFGTIAILAGQLIALAWVLNAAIGLPKSAGCLLSGIVMTIYFSAGGIASSARVNLIQLTVLLLGFALALPLSVDSVGGWDVVVGVADRDYGNFLNGPTSGWILIPMLVPAFIVSPGLLQKVYSATDDRAVRVGVGANAVALLLFAAVPPILGLVALSAHPGLENPDLALPTLLMESVPPVVGSLGLVALFSAEVSSADAILFMLATSLSQDLYRRYLSPKADDVTVLRVARLAAAGGGALGVALSVVAESVIDVMTIFYTLLSVSLFVPIIAGLYLRWTRTPEILASIVTGVTAVLVTHLAATVQLGISAMVGLIVSVTTAGLVGAARISMRQEGREK